MRRNGYTVVELMATIVIVAVLAATVGMFFVKLLTIQEREREEGYIRERLSDICGMYADFMSVGCSFNVATNLDNPVTLVKYRQETGGVSLETGLVSRAAYLASWKNTTNETLDLNILFNSDPLDNVSGFSLFSRLVRGDAPLIPLTGDMVKLEIIPLGIDSEVPTESSMDDEKFPGYMTADAALGLLRVSARYEIENDEGDEEIKTVFAERVVRLWNRE